MPAFWSGQFGVNIKSVGVPSFGDEIVFTQGSVKERRFAAAYGRRGRIVGAVTFNHGKWLDFYGALIERSARFHRLLPGTISLSTRSRFRRSSRIRERRRSFPTVVLTGHDPTERSAEFQPPRR